jgi:uncharacterized protein involved in outer membrane biogenesis
MPGFFYDMKIIRNIFLILATLFIIAIVGLLILFFIFTNSTHVKSQIAEQVFKQTGISLQIKGNVSWTLAEELGVRFTEVEIAQPMPGDKNSVIESPRVDVFVAWRPLLSRRIEIHKILLHHFSLNFTRNFSQKPINITASGNLALDLPEQHLTVDDLTINSGDIHATGNVSVEKILQTPELTGQLKMARVNLPSALRFFSSDINLQGELNNAVIGFHYTPKEWVSGDLSAERLSMNYVTVNHLAAKFTGNPQQIRFTPVRGVIAGGAFNSQINVTNWLTNPYYQIDSALTHAESSVLWHSDILHGPVSLYTHLTLETVDKTPILSHLNGNVRLNMAEGTLNHIDLLKQIRLVRQFLQGNAFAGVKEVTHFSKLAASGNIKEGVFYNDDFILESPDLQAAGNGKVNLVDQQIKYHLQVKAQGKISGNDFGVSVPLKITGDLAHPKVKIDVGGLSFTIQNIFGHHHHASAEKALQ